MEGGGRRLEAGAWTMGDGARGKHMVQISDGKRRLVKRAKCQRPALGECGDCNVGTSRCRMRRME
eukprot:1693526-Alexandrium_andersonii.AAC.1